MASLLKVDKLDPQSGTALEIGTSGDTVTVPSGATLTLTSATLNLPTTITSTTEVKTNKVSPATGVAFAMGDSGDTFTVPSGATLDIAGTISNSGTATGFGSIAWQAVQTSSPITGAAGKGYPVNTTSGAITLNLPAGSVGDQVSVVDYAGTFDTNACTIAANGSEKINGSTGDTFMGTERQAQTFTYVDSTQGWVVTSGAPPSLNPYIVATGGTITTVSTDYKVHTFLSTGTFTITNPGSATGSNQVEVLVVGGGGSGGGDVGAGGGGGGIVEGTITQAVTAADYTITVGAAGAGVTGPGGNNGGDSYFANGSASTYECIANGGGRGGDESTANGSAGGSGGGGAGSSGTGGAASGSTAATGTTARGYAGGDGASDFSGGGGGAGAVGAAGSSAGGAGGAGFQDNIDGNNYYWSGGGGGGAWGSGSTAGNGATGGGGGGSAYFTSCSGGSGGSGGSSAINSGGAGSGDDSGAGAGGVNSGGGGGGAGNYWGACTSGASGNGGSGIVIVKYKFQN